MFPVKDAELVPYTTNWKTRIVASPATWNFSVSEADAYADLSDAYIAANAAYTDSVAAGTRSKSLLAARNSAKAELLRVGREMYASVQDSITISDADKALLSVVIRKTSPSPSPIPGSAHKLTFGKVWGTSVEVLLQDGSIEGSRRRKAPYAVGAAVLSFVGDDAPADPRDFKLEGVTGKTKVSITFPADTPPGQRVWVAAYWFNGAKKSGATCMPQSIRLPGMSTVGEDGEEGDATEVA